MAAKSETEAYLDELDVILDRADASVTSLLLTVLVTQAVQTNTLIASGKFSVSKTLTSVKNLKKLPGVSKGIEMSLVPAVVAAIDLFRKNKPVGEVLDIAREAANSSIDRASEYFEEKHEIEPLNSVKDILKSAKLTAKWMVRNAVFSALEKVSKLFKKSSKKTWVTRHDDRVRVTHKLLDGQTVKTNETFTIPNTQMTIRYPGDMSAPPSEFINCRCSLLFS